MVTYGVAMRTYYAVFGSIIWESGHLGWMETTKCFRIHIAKGYLVGSYMLIIITILKSCRQKVLMLIELTSLKFCSLSGQHNTGHRIVSSKFEMFAKMCITMAILLQPVWAGITFQIVSLHDFIFISKRDLRTWNSKITPLSFYSGPRLCKWYWNQLIPW